MSVHLKSQNVRGLQDNKKRRSMFYSFHKSNYNIFLLQETHSSIECEQQWQNEWGGKIVFSHGSRNSKGVCILFKNNFPWKIHGSMIDENGRYIILEVELYSISLLLGTIYGPNRDDPQFFIDFIQAIESFDNPNYIIAGDWNFVLNLDFDKKGGLLHTNHYSRDIILAWMEESDLVDIWRHTHPGDFKFTWKRLRPSPGIFCRLDFFLVSFGLLDKVESTDIVPGFRSDHSAVTLLFLTLMHTKGPGHWKLNCSYLNDIDFIEGVRKTISDTAEFNQNSNPMLFWDTLKCQIRGFALRFCARKKRSKSNIIAALEKRLKFLESIISERPCHGIETEIQKVQEDLNNFIDDKAKGAMIRSRCRWYEEGEKSSKYFLTLEKRNFNNKTLDRLQLENGKVITNPNEISKEQFKFYQKLYTSNNTDVFDGSEIDDFLGGLTVPKLSEEVRFLWEADISENEIYLAIKSTQSGKAPGLDGLPIEFYKAFWVDIKDYFMSAIKTAYETNSLSISQRQGLINLIPKKDKNPLSLKNWRPISLLNSDYKLIAKVIATRIKACLNFIIHSDQTGFLKDRYIGENIIKAISIIEYAEQEDLPALLMFVDYEKAFDTVEWNYVEECLLYFNLSYTIINWVKILYRNITSCVSNNGWFSEFFVLSRGVRQGCPLSPYLFIISAEIFAISIRGNDKIKGININGESSKIGQYADDTYMAFLFDKDSLDEILYTLDKFELLSGLKVNYDKTEILRIGSLKNTDAKLYTQRKLSWTNNPSVLLGISLGTELNEVIRKNYEQMINKIQNIVKLWKNRQITLIGRITIIKVLLLSQLIYRLSVLPSPLPEQMKKINDIFFDYLWNNKKHFIDQKVMINGIGEGGLNMIDISSKDISIKSSWVKRLCEKDNTCLQKIASYFIPNADGLFWSGNLNVSDALNLMQHSSIIWNNIVKAWCIYNFSSPTCLEDILNQQIWYNSYILIQKQPFFFGPLHLKGVLYIKDLVKQDGHIMTADEILIRYSLNKKYVMLLNSIIGAVPQQWKVVLKNSYPNFIGNTIFISNIEKAFRSPRLSKFIYNQILIKKCKPFSGRIVDKWIADLGQALHIDRDFISRSFQLIRKATISPKHRVFQFKLIHRCLVTNKSLYDWKLKDTNICTFCESHIETIVHLLWDCTKVQSFWKEVFDWIKEVTDTNIIFNSKEILLGIDNNNLTFYNAVFIMVKQYIYACRCKNMLLNIQTLIHNVKHYIQAEKYIAVKNDKVNYHNRKWSLFQF